MSRREKPVVEFLLKLINFMFSLCGLAIMLYGLYSLIKWKHAKKYPTSLPGASKVETGQLPLLLGAVHLSKLLSHKLPTAWFIYFVVAMGAVVFIMSCFGYVGTASRSPCCLVSYSLLLIGVTLIEVCISAFITFDHQWEEVMPRDRDGSFPSFYRFLKMKWKKIRWFALATLLLQVIALILALYLRCMILRAWYDSSDDDDDQSLLYPSKLSFKLKKRITVSNCNTATPTNITQSI